MVPHTFARGGEMCVDSCLIERVKGGDEIAFSELVVKYRPVLLKYCYHYTKDFQTSEDIVQESLVKAFWKISSFEGRSSFKNWLFKITINNMRNKLRKKSLLFINLETLNSFLVEAKSEKILLEKQLKTILDKQIEDLPSKQKQALKMRIFDDLSFKEISKVMGCPYDTAKANYRHGLLRLRKQFEKHKDYTFSILEPSSSNYVEVI